MNTETHPTQMIERAQFAGGCFWCMEPPFENEPGVLAVISGYTGGTKPNPTYEEVSDGHSGHIESIQIEYDPKIVSYERLLEIFWHQIDPTDSGGQFVDRGSQYRSAIFYLNQKQKEAAEKSKKALENSGQFSQPIVTAIIEATPFYRAENYHQDYYKKNPLRYKFYRYNSGRDQFLESAWKKKLDSEKSPKNLPKASPEDSDASRPLEKYADLHLHSTVPAHWHKPTREELKKHLPPLQFEITQDDGTESAFDNAYWDNKEEGIYVDIMSNEALFSSTDKFDSKTGWPSFTRPLIPKNIVEKTDRKFFTTRTEIRSKVGDNHLGHVFPDGPPPTGLRYCINSAALKFIPKSEMEAKGFGGDYLKIFSK